MIFFHENTSSTSYRKTQFENNYMNNVKTQHLCIPYGRGLPLQGRHSEHNGASKHRRIDCLLNRLFGRRAKKTSKLRVTGLCEGNSPMTGEFPAQMASEAENVSILWDHHDPLNVWHLQYVWRYLSAGPMGRSTISLLHNPGETNASVNSSWLILMMGSLSNRCPRVLSRHIREHYQGPL